MAERTSGPSAGQTTSWRVYLYTKTDFAGDVKSYSGSFSSASSFVVPDFQKVSGPSSFFEILDAAHEVHWAGAQRGLAPSDCMAVDPACWWAHGAEMQQKCQAACHHRHLLYVLLNLALCLTAGEDWQERDP